jgi:MFS family permease
MTTSTMDTLKEGFRDGAVQLKQSWRNAPEAARRIKADPRSVVKGASLAPLLVLYGHSLLDAIDRSGFSTILPEIRDRFGLTDSEIASVAGVALFVSLLLGVPTAYYSDRGKRRTWWLASGAVFAAIFSTITGTAATVGMFVFGRAAFGLGLRLNDPVQASLLSDYYAVETRPTTFAGRQGMDNAGQLIGPLYFGLVAMLIDWRVAVISVAVPAAVLAVWSLRLHEPSRGAPEREAMGMAPDAEIEEEEPAGFFESMKILHRITTVRRLYFALPFLVGGVLGIGILFPLFLEDVFGLSAGERGAVTSITNVAGILGLFFGVPIARRYLVSGNPEGMLELIRLAGVLTALFLGAIAASPNLVVMTIVGLLFYFCSSIFVPTAATVIAMVVPARVRGVGFAMLGLWALPGLLMIPVASGVSDASGHRWGMVVGLPLFVIGSFIIASGKRDLRRDIESAFAAAMNGATVPAPPSAEVEVIDLTADVEPEAARPRRERPLSAG